MTRIFADFSFNFDMTRKTNFSSKLLYKIKNFTGFQLQA